MFKTRTTKTASGKTAVQVVERAHQKIRIIKHIGSAGNDDELKLLQKQAERYIVDSTSTQPLFPDLFGVSRPLLLSEFEQVVDRLSVTRSLHTFAHEFLSSFYKRTGLIRLGNDLLRDLAFLRLIEPCSKLRSIMLLQKYFGIGYTEDTVYEGLPKLILLKDEAEKIAVSYAEQTFGFDFTLIYYDVTTLYYESFTEDPDTIDAEGDMIEKGLRKGGLGKEIKPGQPQIVIGLMVTKEGFPVFFEVYEGNTFEGDTFIPSILSFQKKHKITVFTIVADAAMISLDNVEKLKEKSLSYIVGGRIANLKDREMKQIYTELIGENHTTEELKIIDGKSVRIQTERGLLLCDFSLKRYLKDKREMEKQIQKAEYFVSKNSEGKRTKFLMLKQSEKKTGKKGKEKVYTLNNDLIKKTKFLLGIKGYYTNLFEKNEKLTDTDIINHYHNLWHVEKAFRIAKSDLQARPIFHHKRDSIEAHIFIVFVSLCLTKAIELETSYSIRSVKDMIWDILDVTFADKITGKQFVKRTEVKENPMVKLLEN